MINRNGQETLENVAGLYSECYGMELSDFQRGILAGIRLASEVLNTAELLDTDLQLHVLRMEGVFDAR